jgi:hypothetical protein
MPQSRPRIRTFIFVLTPNAVRGAMTTKSTRVSIRSNLKTVSHTMAKEVCSAFANRSKAFSANRSSMFESDRVSTAAGSLLLGRPNISSQISME